MTGLDDNNVNVLLEKESKTPAKQTKEDIHLEKLISQMEEVLKVNKNQEREIERLTAELSKSKDFGDITIGCNDINGIFLKDKNSSFKIPIRYGEEIEVSEKDLRDVIKSDTTKWRKFFESGMLYFKDEDNYAVFKMVPKFSMSEKSIHALLSITKVKDLEKKIREVTNSNRDSFVVHALWYRIIDLISKNVIENFPYQNRAFLESYFACKIDTAVNSLQMVPQYRK